MLKIAGGWAKGKRLRSPRTRSIRPTTALVKEYIFGLLDLLDGKEILDLFAGTGNLGLEALSRGAKEITFVDSGQESLRLIRENLRKFPSNQPVKIIRSDVLEFLRRSGRKKQTYDIILADPPFQYQQLSVMCELIGNLQLIKQDGFFIVEHTLDLAVNDPSFSLERIRFRSFGGNKVSVFQLKVVQ